MLRNGPRERKEFDAEMIQKIVDLLAEEFPLGSDNSRTIINPYMINNYSTNLGIDAILSVVARELDVDYHAIAYHEHDIIPAYAERIGWKQKGDKN